MTSAKNRACAPRARVAKPLPAAAALVAAALVAAAIAHAPTGSRVGAHALTTTQGNTKVGADAPDAASMVGVWKAALPTGLRIATISIVPSGEGFAGSFVGHDYDRMPDSGARAEGPPPKVTMRSGSLMSDVKVEAGTLTFKMYLRPSVPPPGRPAGFDVTGEIRFQGGDAAELKLSAPSKPEPMVLKLTRE